MTDFLDECLRPYINGTALMTEQELANFSKQYVLLEKNHVSNIFDEVMFRICEMVFEHYHNDLNKLDYNKEYYTGYCYDSDRELPYKTTSTTINHPIYIKLIFENSNTYASVHGREVCTSNDKIVISINIFRCNYFRDEIFETLPIELADEFIHVRHMWRYNYKDILNNKKNQSYLILSKYPNIKMDIDTDRDTKLESYISMMMYLMSPTELQAHVNSFAKFIKTTKEEKIVSWFGKDEYDRDKKIKRCVINSGDSSLFNEFENCYWYMLKMLYKNNAAILSVFCFFMCEFGYYKDTKRYFTEEMTTKFYNYYKSNKKIKIHPAYFEECKKVLDVYKKTLDNYLWKLYLVAYDILRERGLLDKKSTVVTESDMNNYFNLKIKYMSNYYKLKNRL